MGKVEQHDLSEYHIMLPGVVLDAAATVGFVPIPQSGQVKRVKALVTTAQAAAPMALTFLLGTTQMLAGGATATLTIPSAGSALGNIEAIDFDPNSKANYALEAIDGESGIAATKNSVITIESDEGGSAGIVTLIFTIGR
jgi:hypothetical protein